MRVVSIMGAVGLAIGGVLALVLKFVTGPRVAAGLGAGQSSGPSRRYADYLPVDVGRPAWLPLVPVSLGTGLVAGLLVGAFLALVRSRRSVSLPGAAVAAFSLTLGAAAIGLGLAVELHFYGRVSAPSAGLGWYSYSPLASGRTVAADGIFYGGGSGGGSSVWPLVLTGGAVGVAVAMIAGALVLLLRRRHGGLSGSSPTARARR